MLSQQPINPFEKHLQKAKIERLPEYEGLILEIGCGDGSVFKGTNYIVEGVDIDSYSLQKASEVSNYKSLYNSIDGLDVKKYECVCLLGVLEHMDDDEIDKILTFAKQAKAVYITVPNGRSFHREVGMYLGLIKSYNELGDHDREIGHTRYFTKDTLLKILLRYFEWNDIVELGSLGFKFDRSAWMTMHLGKMKAIEEAAKYNNLIGVGNFKGAELYTFIKPR